MPGTVKGENSVANAVGVGKTDTPIFDVVDLAHVVNTVLRGNVQGSFGLGRFFRAGALMGILENDLAQHVES
jgi:hypothetical protein